MNVDLRMLFPCLFLFAWVVLKMKAEATMKDVIRDAWL